MLLAMGLKSDLLGDGENQCKYLGMMDDNWTTTPSQARSEIIKLACALRGRLAPGRVPGP